MVKARLSKHRADAQRRRIVYLLEALALETGVTDVSHKEQCPKCGEYYAQVSSHKPHCDGPN